MLRIEQSKDYEKRWPVAEQAGLIQSPSFKDKPATSLQVRNPDGLLDLSFIFFTGWLFTGILNRTKDVIRISLVPFGPNDESSMLVLYDPTTHLASPSRAFSEIFDPDYFVCPLDRSGGKESTTQMLPCRGRNFGHGITGLSTWFSRLLTRSEPKSDIRPS